MSKNINVNPGQYRVRGRERQGEDIPHDVERQRLSLIEQRGRAGAWVTKPSDRPPRPSAKKTARASGGSRGK